MLAGLGGSLPGSAPSPSATTVQGPTSAPVPTGFHFADANREGPGKVPQRSQFLFDKYKNSRPAPGLWQNLYKLVFFIGYCPSGISSKLYTAHIICRTFTKLKK